MKHNHSSPAHDHSGHNQPETPAADAPVYMGLPHERYLRPRFLVAVVLTLPVLFLSMTPMVSHDLYDYLTMRDSAWVQFVLTTPVFFWCGAPFIRRWWKSIVERDTNMFTLTVTGTGAAYFYSLAAVVMAVSAWGTPSFLPFLAVLPFMWSSLFVLTIMTLTANVKIEAFQDHQAHLIEELEQSRAERNHAVQQERVAGHNEMAQLKATAQALRDELQKAHADTDNAVRMALVGAQGEIAQLRQTVAGLRESLELAQIDKTNAISRERALAADEVTQLQGTIQNLRDQIDSTRHSS